MSKVFRYHQGRDNIKGWGISSKYNNNVYGDDPESIKDPAGATASKEITSIPSPFARMDLVKAAFAFVNTKGLDGIPSIIRWFRMLWMLLRCSLTTIR